MFFCFFWGIHTTIIFQCVKPHIFAQSFAHWCTSGSSPEGGWVQKLVALEVFDLDWHHYFYGGLWHLEDHSYQSWGNHAQKAVPGWKLFYFDSEKPVAPQMSGGPPETPPGVRMKSPKGPRKVSSATKKVELRPKSSIGESGPFYSEQDRTGKEGNECSDLLVFLGLYQLVCAW